MENGKILKTQQLGPLILRDSCFHTDLCTLRNMDTSRATGCIQDWRELSQSVQIYTKTYLKFHIGDIKDPLKFPGFGKKLPEKSENSLCLQIFS